MNERTHTMDIVYVYPGRHSSQRVQRDLDECWATLHNEITTLHEILYRVHRVGFHFYCQGGIRYCTLGQMVARQLLKQTHPTLSFSTASIEAGTKALRADLATHIPPGALYQIHHLLRHLVVSMTMFKVLADEVYTEWTTLYRQDNDVIISMDVLANARELHCCLPAIISLYHDGTTRVTCRARGGRSYT